jgi:hypothetical protein
LIDSVKCCESPDALSTSLRAPSGYVREAALEQSVKLQLAELLPRIAPLLNDWVQVIRDRARAAVLTLLPFATPRDLLLTLAQVARLHSATRADHREWIAQFEETLLQFVSTDLLAGAVTSPDPGVARACFDLINKRGLLDKEALASIGLRAHQDILIAKQAAHLAAVLAEPARSTLCRLALQSHFGAVKTIALRALLSGEPEADAHEIAMAALSASHSSLRGIAAFWLASRGVDVAAHYRVLLETPNQGAKLLVLAIGMLGVTRSLVELDLVRSFTSSSLSSVRLAAFAAWLKLAPEDKDQLARRAVADPSPAIRKFAVRTIRKGAYVPFDFLYDTLRARGDIRLLLVCCESEKWAGLEAIARTASPMPQDDDNWPRLVSAMRRWASQTGRIFSIPTVRQARFLLGAEASDSLDRLLAGDRQSASLLHDEVSRYCLPVANRDEDDSGRPKSSC